MKYTYVQSYLLKICLLLKNNRNDLDTTTKKELFEKIVIHLHNGIIVMIKEIEEDLFN